MGCHRKRAWILLSWVFLAPAPLARSQYAGVDPVVLKAAFARDGRWAAFVYRDRVTLLDFENRREECLIRSSDVTALAFSYDGTELAISTKGAYEDSPIGESAPFAEMRIVDVRTGALKKRFPDTRVMHVLEAAFTPAGALFALAANPGANAARIRRGFEQLFLWEATAGKLTPLMPADKARRLYRCSAAFAPDAGALVVSYGAGGTEEIRVYDTANPSSARRVARATGPLSQVVPAGFGSVAMSPDARMLAYGAYYVTMARPRPASPRTAGLSPWWEIGGESVFILEEDGSVREVRLAGLDRRAGALAPSWDGKTLALGGRDGFLRRPARRLRRDQQYGHSVGHEDLGKKDIQSHG